MRRARLPLAWLWATSLVAVWLAVGVVLRQSPLATQPSRALVAYGVFKGATLTPATAWKLIAAQWFHVHLGHMLLNAAIIGVVGTALSHRAPPTRVVLLGIVGGAIAQGIGALADPAAFISGASPAYLVLAGAALGVVPPRSIGWTAALAAIIVAVALDWHVAATVKAGHIAGFAIGLAAGLLVLRRRPRRR